MSDAISPETEGHPSPDEAPEHEVVLFRCGTPTNFLCPCGTVARRLRSLKIEYRTERVARKRGHRPEIRELTKQAHVPVLVDDVEVVHDSKRIIEYLEWRYNAQSS